MREQQIAHLRVRFGLTYAQAAVVAALHYGECNR